MLFDPKKLKAQLMSKQKQLDTKHQSQLQKSTITNSPSVPPNECGDDKADDDDLTAARSRLQTVTFAPKPTEHDPTTSSSLQTPSLMIKQPVTGKRQLFQTGSRPKITVEDETVPTSDNNGGSDEEEDVMEVVELEGSLENVSLYGC